MTTAYRVARRPVEKEPISGADLQRQNIKNYQTTDWGDRMGNESFYRKMMTNPVKRVTRIRASEKDSELDFEYAEGNLQLKQVEKKFDRLSKKAKEDLRRYFQKR
jgi:hypothetical protein